MKETRYANVVRLRGALYGCLKSRDKLVSFGEVESFGSFQAQQGPISLNGRWVAFGLRTASRDGTDFAVRIIDLRGKLATRAPLPVRQDVASTGEQTYPGFTAISITPRGTAAWIIKNIGAAGPHEVWSVDARPAVPLLQPRLAAQGADIDPQALTLTDSRVGWLQGGQQRSAPTRR